MGPSRGLADDLRADVHVALADRPLDAGLAATDAAGVLAYLELDGARVDAVVLSRLPTD